MFLNTPEIKNSDEAKKRDDILGNTILNTKNNSEEIFNTKFSNKSFIDKFSSVSDITTNNHSKFTLLSDEPTKLDERPYIINNINTIYGQVEGQTRKISLFLMIIFLINTINFSNFWTLNNMVSELKSTYYCFDHNSGEFYICQASNFCDNFNNRIQNLIYLSNDNITHFNKEEELSNINKYFKSIAIFDIFRYSTWNTVRIRKTEPILNDYKLIIAINKNENYNLFSRYNLVCNTHSTLVFMGLLMVFGVFIFGILFGWFADVFGRKNVLFILIIFQICGAVFLFGFDFALELKIKKDAEITILRNKTNHFQKILEENFYEINNTIKKDQNKYNVNSSRKLSEINHTINEINDINYINYNPNNLYNNTISLNKEESINQKEKENNNIFYSYDLNTFNKLEPFPADVYLNPNYLNFLQYRGNSFNFTLYNFDERFQQNFFFLEKAKRDSFLRRNYFLEKKAFFLIGFIFSFSTVPAIFNLCLAYFMELSLNTSSTISNYGYFTKSYILSYLISHYTNIYLNSYSYSILIFAFFQIIFLIIFNHLNIESPRFCYESSDWIQLTETFKRNYLSENEAESNNKKLQLIVRTKEDPIYRQEINLNKNQAFNRWNIFDKYLNKRIFSYNFFRDHSIIEKNINNEKLLKIELKNHLKYPFLMQVLLFKRKHHKDVSLLIFSMVFNFAMTFFIVQIKFTNEIFFSREVLYREDYTHLIFLINCSVMILSNYLFLFLNQIWGYPIIMSLCYFFIFIFSIILGLEDIRNKISPYMLDDTFAVLSEYFYDYQYYFFRKYIIANSFFVHGLFFPFYIYITKLSMTDSRVTYYGGINLIIYSLWVCAILLSKYFESNYFFVSECSLVGFLISYFVVRYDNDGIVKDFRILEKRNTKEQ